MTSQLKELAEGFKILAEDGKERDPIIKPGKDDRYDTIFVKVGMLPPHSHERLIQCDWTYVCQGLDEGYFYTLVN